MIEEVKKKYIYKQIDDLFYFMEARFKIFMKEIRKEYEKTITNFIKKEEMEQKQRIKEIERIYKKNNNKHL